MQALRRGLDLILETACAALLACLVVVLAWQVFSRYALSEPSSVTEEALRYGVIWVSLLGAAYATGQGSHLAVEILRDRISTHGQLRLDVLISLAFILFATSVLIYGGGRAVGIASHQTSPVMKLPMSYVYLSLPVSGILIILYSILNLADLRRGISHHTDLEDIELQDIAVREE